MNPLTEKQRATLEFIRNYIKQHRMAPTMSEIAEGMGWRSPNAAQAHVDALKRKGLVTMRRGVSRGLALTRCCDIAIPEGWMLVPIEPTQAMIDAHTEGMIAGGASKAYREMLAAAPEVGK